MIILDGVESVFEPRQLLGQYRSGCEAYRELLELIAARQHQSCLLWIGREETRFVATSAVQSHQLSGLSADEVQMLLLPHVSAATAADWQALRDRYGGNPRYLLLIASAIKTLFQGQLAQFLQQPLELDDEIAQQLESIFARLTVAEQQVMYWLAIAHEPLPLDQLRAVLVEDLSERVIRSLSGRSLCGSHRDAAEKASLSQSPLIQLYCLQHFQQKIRAELDQELPDLLNSHALIQAQARAVIQQKQRHHTLQPLTEYLQRSGLPRPALAKKVQRLLDAIRASPLRQQGYGAGNLINLCQQLDLPISQFNWSQLSLRQADLQQVNLYGADFSQSVLTETVFAKPLGKNPVAAFHPAEPLLAIGDDEGRIILWRLSDGKPQQILSNASGAAVYALAFSHDGELLAEGAEDNQLRLWSLQQEHYYTFEGHTQPVRCVALSLDDQMLASGSEDGSIWLWEVGSGSCLALIEAAAPIITLSFSPDGDWLMGCSEAQTIHYWHIRDQSGSTFHNSTNSRLSTAAFVPMPMLVPVPAFNEPEAGTGNQTWLPIAVSCGDRSILLWQVETDRPWCRLPEQLEMPPAAIALSPDGRYLAYSQQSRQITLWCLTDQTQIPAPDRFEQPISFLRFSPDSRFLAIGHDYQMQIWDLGNAQVFRTFCGSRYPVSSFTGDFEQGLLVSGHRDASVRVWQVNLYSDHSRCEQFFEHSNWVRALAISPDGTWLASGSDDCTIRLRQIAAAEPIRTLSGHTDPVRALAFDPASKILASAGQDGTIYLWQIETGTVKQLPGHTAAVYALSFSADGRWLVSGGDDQSIYLWHLEQGYSRQIHQAHSRRIHRLRLDDSGTQLLSGSYDQQAKLWQVDSSICLKTWQQPQHRVCEVLFQPDGVPCVISSSACALALWSLMANQQPRYIRQAHATAVEQTALSTDAQHLISLSSDAELGIWDLASGMRLRTLHVDRPYERLNIRDAVGLEALERQLLQLLGAVEL